MASAVLQIVGVAVGGLFGGPIGASIGGAIGGAIGAALEPGTNIQGPRLTDLRVLSSAYGLEIPLIYGAENRVSGNLIWTTGLVERRKKKKSGGKGGGGTTTTTYSYSTSCAVAIGEGPCVNVKRIWANSKLLWDRDEMAAEVARLLDKYNEIQIQVNYYQLLSEADPLNETYQQLYASYTQQASDALAGYNSAVAAYGVATAGSQSWSISIGSGLQEGALGYLAFYPGNLTQTPDPKIEAAMGAGNTPAYRKTCYIVFGDLQLADYGNAVPNFEFEIDGLSPRTLGGVLSDICIRTGMEPDEYTTAGALNSELIRGFVIASGSSAMTAISPLGATFSFDTYEQAGTTRFVRRGQFAIATIEKHELNTRQRDESAAQMYALERLPDHELVKSTSLTYRDPDRNYQENTQRATRLFGNAMTNRSEQLALTISSDNARQIVDRSLWAAWSDRVPARISVADKFGFLVAGQLVMVEMAGTYLPFRIENRIRGVNGIIDLELRQEDPFIYDGNADGESSAVPVQTTSQVGDTLVYIYDAPILLPTDDNTGFYWAMDAVESGWRGGIVFRSVDDGLNYSEVIDSNERNISGTVASALPNASADIWDRTNTITVILNHADHELESFSETEVLNGKNSFWLGASDGSHGEVIQFATATLISNSPKTYQLSNLLRGRRATEHETSLHTTNEIFVFFDVDLLRTMDFGSADFNKSRRYKGVSIYQSEDDIVTSQEFIATGERKRPRSPVHAIGDRDSSNNLTITWIRRVRGYTSGPGYDDAPLDEVSESYQIEIMSGMTVKRTLTATTPTVTYTAAQQTTDGFTPGNPITIKIYQLSAIVGRGHPGVFTI